jgi:hypothetical protein
MRRPIRLAPLLPALLCLGLGSPAASAEEPAPGAPPTIYKWVDANGVAHYTTDLGRVPRSVRGSVRALGGGGGAAETEASTDVANTPPPEAPSPDVKPAEPLPEWDVGDAPPSSGAARPGSDGAFRAESGAPPPPRATGKDRWAEIDRPVDGVTGEPVPAAETVAQPGVEPGAEPTQTASAEPVAPAESPADRESQRRDLDARIATLQEEVAADEEALKGFLAVATPKDPAEIAYDSSFREVAERLPKRLAELRSLQSERAQLDSQ